MKGVVAVFVCLLALQAHRGERRADLPACTELSVVV